MAPIFCLFPWSNFDVDIVGKVTRQIQLSLLDIWKDRKLFFFQKNWKISDNILSRWISMYQWNVRENNCLLPTNKFLSLFFQTICNRKSSSKMFFLFFYVFLLLKIILFCFLFIWCQWRREFSSLTSFFISSFFPSYYFLFFESKLTIWFLHSTIFPLLPW